MRKIKFIKKRVLSACEDSEILRPYRTQKEKKNERRTAYSTRLLSRNKKAVSHASSASIFIPFILSDKFRFKVKFMLKGTY